MMYSSILKSVSYNKLYKNSANISHIHPPSEPAYTSYFSKSIINTLFITSYLGIRHSEIAL